MKKDNTLTKGFSANVSVSTNHFQFKKLASTVLHELGVSVLANITSETRSHCSAYRQMEKTSKCISTAQKKLSIAETSNKVERLEHALTELHDFGETILEKVTSEIESNCSACKQMKKTSECMKNEKMKNNSTETIINRKYCSCIRTFETKCRQ